MHPLITKDVLDRLLTVELVQKIVGGAVAGGVVSVSNTLHKRRAERLAQANAELKRQREALAALNQQETLISEARMTYTNYRPIEGTPENPAAKMEQCIVRGKIINLEDVFPKSQWPAISKYLEEAKKYCTKEDPIVFNHLDKVIPESDKLNSTEEILSSWQAHFYGIYHRQEEFYPSKQDVLSSPEIARDGGWKNLDRDILYPLLVYEPTAKHKRMRIFIMRQGQLENGYKLKESEVVIEGETGRTKAELHHHYSRLETNRSISNLYQRGNLNNLLKQIKVKLPVTGPKLHEINPGYAY